MKYQFTILTSRLPLLLDVYKKTGGYLEVVSCDDIAFTTVISDNPKFLYHDDFKSWTRTPVPFLKQDETEFSSFSAIGVGIGGSRHLNTGERSNLTCAPKVVNIQFADLSDDRRERIVTVDGEEYFRDENAMEAYGELNDPLRKLELWLFDMELRRVNL